MSGQTILIIILTNIISISLVIIIYLLLRNRKLSYSTTGITLGPYINLITLSGKGGMARIYKAKNSQTGEECILKVLRQEHLGDQETIRKFIREGEILKRIKQESPDAPITSFHRSGTIRTGLVELPFLELEYIEGIDLSEVLNRRKLTEGEAEVLAYRILKGLKVAHKVGAIHRDIKPSNIILRNGRIDDPVIIDFGVAKDISSKSVTAGGYGTASYMSPEQVQGERVTEKTDIYSLGVVLYECLTGVAPFEGDGPFEVMRKHREEAPDISKLRGISERIRNIILEMLTKDAEGRPELDEIIERLSAKVRTGEVKVRKVEYIKEERGKKKREGLNLIKPVAVGVLLSMIIIPIVLTILSKPVKENKINEAVNIQNQEDPRKQIAEDILKEAELMINYKDIEGAEKKLEAYKKLGINYLKEKEIEIKEKIIKIKEEKIIKEAEQRARKEAEERRHPGMVYIRGGGFYMGCTEGDSECSSDEKPRHYVNIKSFYMDKYEVTVADYRKCVEAGVCTKPDKGGDCNWNSGRDNHPINCVYWYQAKEYCKWAGKRLPTEAEWEYAARGGRNDWKYPWGNNISHNDANYEGVEGRDQWKYTSPVGSFEANGYGLYDMAGNVWEWVEDCWNGSYEGAPTDGSAWLSGNCSLRVLHGGSWLNNSRNLRVSIRSGAIRSDRSYDIGFRCASTD